MNDIFHIFATEIIKVNTYANKRTTQRKGDYSERICR